MPILAVPIICSITDKLLGAFEVVNTRGIEGISSTGSSKLNKKDYEIVDFFSKQLAQCVINQEDREVEGCLKNDAHDGVVDEKAPFVN